MAVCTTAIFLINKEWTNDYMPNEQRRHKRKRIESSNYRALDNATEGTKIDLHTCGGTQVLKHPPETIQCRH